MVYRYVPTATANTASTVPHLLTSSQPLHNHIRSIVYRGVLDSLVVVQLCVYLQLYIICAVSIYIYNIYTFIKHFPSVR